MRFQLQKRRISDGVRAAAGLGPSHDEDILAEQVRGRVLALLSRLTPGHLDARTALGGGKSVREALATLDKHDLDHAAELRG